MAEHDDRITARHLVFVSTEATPQLRTHAQHVKEISAHQRAVFHLGQRGPVVGDAEREILRCSQP